MNINKYHGSYNRSKRSGGVGAIKYICIHYTAGTGSAKNNCIYFSGGNRDASADYFIDDNGIWEYNDPDEGYYCWSVGDGKGAYGITNANSISVEVVNNGGDFTAKEISYLKELVPYLMKKYGVPASRVVRHYDASRKQCPIGYINQVKWNTLHTAITNGATAAPTNAPKQIPGDAVNNAGLYYRAHVQGLGWLDSVHDGQTAGTTGYGLRLEALKIAPPEGLELEVCAHIQGDGWKTYTGIKAGDRSGTGSSTIDPIIGTVGQSKRIEGIGIKCLKNTTGKKLMFRVHVQGRGWTGWVEAGYFAGSVGLSLRIEAIQMKLV